MSTPITPMERLLLEIKHDAMNVRSMPSLAFHLRDRCVSMCAARYLQAKEMGQEVERRAFVNLKQAVEYRWVNP
jgi:hypothetical protein